MKDTRLALPYEMCNLEQGLEHHEKVSEIAGRLRGREGGRVGEEEREERRRGRKSGKEVAITLFPTAA